MQRRTILFITFLCFVPCSLLFGADFVVNSNKSYADNNHGDGICFTGYPADSCTLRAAVEEGMALTGADTITFSAPFDIQPTSEMPTIGDPTDTLIIDGSSQWNTTDNIPGVGIGSTATGLEISSSVVVKGILFFGSGTGIKIIGGGNQIGGQSPHERNVFFNSDRGIYLKPGSDTNVIRYNYFGTKTGTPWAEDDVYLGQYGIEGYMTSHLLIEYNVIGEQQQAGILLNNSGYISIENNHIGNFCTACSRKLPNKYGVKLKDCGAVVISENNISGNVSGQVDAVSSHSMDIIGNRIGSIYLRIDPALSQADGITLSNISLQNTNIRNNTIVYNNGNGIVTTLDCPLIINNRFSNNGKNGLYLQNIADGSKGLISQNSISSNSENGLILDNVDKVKITDNWIGFEQEYWDGGNGQAGIRLENGSAYNIIGGATPDDGNHIGYNHGSGIFMTGTGTSHNQLGNNIFGIGLKSVFYGFRKSGNGSHGIAVYNHADDNVIGLIDGTTSPNLVLDSHWGGIVSINSDWNQIQFNKVGTDGDTLNWGNAYAGIQVIGNYNTIKWNTVANNGFGPDPAWAGIIIQGATSTANHIYKNSIFHNGGAGIDLRDGANGNIMPPLLERFGNIITGTTCSSCTVEFFSGPDKDEGKYFEGFSYADGSGKFSWQIKDNVKGAYLTATTTFSPAFNTFNTSEFSLYVTGHTFPWTMFLPAITGHH